METNKKECTIKELCEYYNVTSVTVERWRKKKGLPFIKRGRSVFFIVDDVEKWMVENNKVIKVNYEEEEKAVN